MGDTALKTMLKKGAAKISWLDGLTALVLMMAIYLFVRPGSPVYVSVKQRLVEREQQNALSTNWKELAEVAIPLYSGAGEPEIIEFSDYECPFCKQVSPTIDSAVAAGVRVAVIHFPLAKHARAVPAAHAALCAARNGRFVDAHHELFSRSDWRSDTTWIRLRANPDSTCVNDQALAALLSRHLSFAQRLGVNATPAFFSRNAIFKGAPTFESLKSLAQDATN